jgi:hypothetical protein
VTDPCPATRFQRQLCGLPAGHSEPHDWHEPPRWGELARSTGVRRQAGEGFTDYQHRILAALEDQP